MWIAFALTAAVGGASTSLLLKRTVQHGGAVVSTIAFRAVGGLILAGLGLAAGGWPAPTPAFWRVTLLVVPPEIAGMVCMTLALRAGDLSLVQPIMGMLPLFVMLSGVVFLHEVPTPAAAAGIVLVTFGVYCIGLRGGGSVWDPLRALARERASWYAVGATVAWSATTLLHKVGIAEVGPFPWAATMTLGSAAGLAIAMLLLGWRRGQLELPSPSRGWWLLVAGTGVCFAIQQVGLHSALRATQAGYVVAVTSTSILIAVGFGIVLLRERAEARQRIAGGALVTAGAALIALWG